MTDTKPLYPTAEQNIPDPKQLLDKIVESASRLIPFDAGGMALWDEQDQVLVPFYSTYTALNPDAPKRLVLGQGVVGKVAQTREPFISGDVRQHKEYVGVYQDVLSEMAVPIIAGERFLGVLDVESRQLNAYTQTHLSILQALADQAAWVLQTSDLYVTLQENYKHLQESHQKIELRNTISQIATSDLSLEESLPRMTQVLAEMADADACAITLWDPVKHKTRRLAAWGIDEEAYKSETNRPPNAPSLTETIAQTRQTYILNDAQHIKNPPTPLIQELNAKALIALPLVARGRVLGAVFLLRIEKSQPFSKEDIVVLQTSLDQIGLGIDNQLLLQETQHSLSETSALLEIASIAANVIKMDEMLPQALDAIQTTLNTKVAGILLFDRYTETLVPLPHGMGFPGSVLKARFSVKAQDSILAEVYRIGLPRYLNEIDSLKGAEKEFAHEAKLENVLVVPLRVQFHPIGVLVVGNRPGGFSGSEAGFLAAAGSHIAATLRHSELLEDTRNRLRETVMLQQVASITSTTLDLDEMLTRTLLATADLLQAKAGFFLLPDKKRGVLQPHEPSAFGVAREWLNFIWEFDGASHFAEVYRHKISYFSNDPTSNNIIERQNILTVPLVTAQETLGVLSLVNRPTAFETTHEVLATAITSSIAAHMQNAIRFKEQQERAQIMSVVNEISQELTENLDPGGLMMKLSALLNSRLAYEMVTVLVEDEERGLIVQGFASTLDTVQLKQGQAFSPPNQLISAALASQQIKLDNDYTDSEWLAALSLPAFQSMMVVPLRHENIVRALLLVASTQVDSFQDIDLQVMETLSPQISSVLENARLYIQAQRRLIQQGIVQQIGQDLAATLNYTELMQAIARHMTRALDTSSCLVAVYSPRDQMVRIEADYRMGNRNRESIEPLLIGSLYAVEARPAMREAIATKSPVRVYRDGSQGTEEQVGVLLRLDQYSQMVLPMIVGDRIIGVVDWMESRRARIFTQEDERLAMILVSQASIAVENARLYRESERRAAQQALLRQVAVELGQATDPTQLLDYLVAVIRESMNAEDVAIATRTTEQRLEVASMLTETIRPKDFVVSQMKRPQDAPQLWNFLQNGYTVHVEATVEPSSYAARELHKMAKGYPGTIILSPITQRGQLLGAIEVRINLNDSLFESQTIQMLESLADQTAIAIDNVILYQREQKRIRQIERVQEAGRVLSAELYLPNLLDMTVQEVVDIFDGAIVSIELANNDTGYYEIGSARGLSNNFINKRRVPIDPLVDSVAESLRVPIYIEEPAAIEDDAEQRKLIEKERIIGILSVPMVKGAQVYGYLRMYHKQGDEHKAFTDQDMEVFQLLAGQLTVAIENARLFREVEDRARELAEANRLKSDFLATISHELRTPMNSIIGFSDTLLSGIYGELNEKQKARVERILRNGRNLLALIDDLLDLSKIEAGRMEIQLETIDLRQEVNACIVAIESQVQTKGLRLESTIPDALPKVVADPLRLRQILNNLFSNAVKFTREGGVKIKIEVHDEETENGIRKTVWTSITDSGIGIRPEHQAIIFDEFRQADSSTTREFGGTGLGLAICRRLLEIMDGRIWVDSELGQGSTFTFTLPAAE